MNVKFLDLAKQNSNLVSEYMDVIREIATSGSYVSGKFVELFEKQFSSALGVNHAIACNSGTSALILSLQAFGIGKGDEVIMPNMTFVATAEAIVALGATPVLVDIDPLTWNLDAKLCEMAISEKTKAIIFVHLHGNPSGISEIARLASMRNITLIEDAAQAHLARVGDRFVGTFGDAAAFSFYPGKNLGALGEGGCLVTNSDKIADAARLFRNWGSKEKYVYLERGTNFRMDEIQAAVLRIKLGHLPAWNQRRREIAENYLTNLTLPKESLPHLSEGSEHVFHIFSVLVENRLEIKRRLADAGVETGIHYPQPINEIVPWQRFVRVSGLIPESVRVSKTFLSLPISESHTDQEIAYVCLALNSILENS